MRKLFPAVFLILISTPAGASAPACRNVFTLDKEGFTDIFPALADQHPRLAQLLTKEAVTRTHWTAPEWKEFEAAASSPFRAYLGLSNEHIQLHGQSRTRTIEGKKTLVITFQNIMLRGEFRREWGERSPGIHRDILNIMNSIITGFQKLRSDDPRYEMLRVEVENVVNPSLENIFSNLGFTEIIVPKTQYSLMDKVLQKIHRVPMVLEGNNWVINLPVE